ncbi:MmgE/PrpD family protein [Advenella kashmirensis W13003]|uniref:MmgE/PrpD family protein n=1 Tax=Advenella kashmirensis W13003 TaxID=1424334 RepID=V8QUK8_9BURK|nr:MmgE/PrpD family protein [Advenella kashmirensis]ETF03005.1 MmgE/PrpD family protein [Advenella kashmirensis W13003]
MISSIQKANEPTDPTGPTGILCNWLAAFELDQTSAIARECARALTLDGIACAIVGARLPWSVTAANIVQKFEGLGDRTIVGWGTKTSAPGAALLNGTFIQGFELDDYHPLAPLHSTSLVLPALWAAIEGQPMVSGRQFLEAAMAGYEVGPRVGKALHGIEMLSRGWHSGAVFGTHSAAAAVGKLLKLDAARFEDALGLAGTQSAGLMAAQYEAMCKRMHHGFAARNGLYAAMLAEGGYTGIKRVFEREYGGFLSTFGEGHEPDASQICKDLGQHWEVEHIVIKPYAAMGGIHSPLDALFDVNRQRALKAEEVTRIEVDVSHPVYHHGWWTPTRPLTPVGAQMNIGYCLAVAVLDGTAMMRQFAPARIDSDDVWALIPKIEVRHEPAFDVGGAAQRFQCRVAVTFTDGERIEVLRQTSRAMAARQSTDEVAEKYRSLTDGLIDRSRQQQIEQMVRCIEEVDDIRDLLALLSPVVKPVFD